MAHRGFCSRREADKLIEQGLVKVDGEIVNTLGIKFPETVNIELTRQGQQQQADRITIMVNKPVGYVSGQAEDDYVPAIRLFTADNRSEFCRSQHTFKPTHWQGLAPAGRLDIDSQGLLVLTQDGRIAKEIINPDTKFEKEYLVRIDGSVTEETLETLRFGLSLDGKALKRAKVKQLNDDQLQFILTEGKKRQIRRMCEAVGLQVTGLKRVRVGELRLGKLAEGEWRYVEADEFRHRDYKLRTNANQQSAAKSTIKSTAKNTTNRQVNTQKPSIKQSDNKSFDKKPTENKNSQADSNKPTAGKFNPWTANKKT